MILVSAMKSDGLTVVLPEEYTLHVNILTAVLLILYSPKRADIHKDTIHDISDL